MIGRRNLKSERVQIDVDWLIGEPAPTEKPRLGKNFFPLVLFLSLVGGSVWCWPVVSKIWLRWEWSRQLVLSQKNSADDVLPILVALNDLSPENTDPVILQLASDDSEKRHLAYNLIEKRLERWEKETKPSHFEIAKLSKSLALMPTKNRESVALRAQIAAHIMRFTGSEGEGSSSTRPELEQMIASAGTLKPKTQGDPIHRKTNDEANGKPTDAIALRNRISNSGIAPATSLIDETVAVNRTDIPPTPVITSRLASRLSIDESVAVSVPSPNQVPSQPPPLLETSQKIVAASPITTEETESASIRGIENRSLEMLLPLLASTQPKIAREASNELMRRGMSTDQLEIALALAQGDAASRMKAMDQLVRDESMDSVPWLVWMAEHADPKVRLRAVRILGTMSNSSPDVLRKLRMLKNREPDGSVSDQISQVLLAAGTPSNSIR